MEMCIYLKEGAVWIETGRRKGGIECRIMNNQKYKEHKNSDIEIQKSLHNLHLIQLPTVGVTIVNTASMGMDTWSVPSVR